MKKLLAAAALVCAAPFAANASSLGFEDPLGAPSNLPTNFGDLFTHEGQDIHHTVDDLLATVSHVNTDGGAHSINSLKILADPAKLTHVDGNHPLVATIGSFQY